LVLGISLQNFEEAQFWKLIQISHVITVVDLVKTQNHGKPTVAIHGKKFYKKYRKG